MYNRYIPQSDGTHHRRPVLQQNPQPQKVASPEPTREPVQASAIPCREEPVSGTVSGFLRALLPKEFDIADLLVVLLLILMAGDGKDEKNSALMTLALYFFM